MPVAIANFTVKFTFNISYTTPQINYYKQIHSFHVGRGAGWNEKQDS